MNRFQNPSVQQAFEKLIKGNQRFVTKQSTYPNQNIEHRKNIVPKATPFTILLTCSDSRVPPELIFDCGFGDLFVIRNAGNLIDDHVLGSIEFGVDSFQIPLIVVLGHTGCAAIQATINGNQFDDHRKSIIETLQPIKDQFDKLDNNLLLNAIEINVSRSVHYLKSCQPTISHYFNTDKVGITGMIYEIESGIVKTLDV